MRRSRIRHEPYKRLTRKNEHPERQRNSRRSPVHQKFFETLYSPSLKHKCGLDGLVSRNSVNHTKSECSRQSLQKRKSQTSLPTVVGVNFGCTHSFVYWCLCKLHWKFYYNAETEFSKQNRTTTEPQCSDWEMSTTAYRKALGLRKEVKSSVTNTQWSFRDGIKWGLPGVNRMFKYG